MERYSILCNLLGLVLSQSFFYDLLTNAIFFNFFQISVTQEYQQITISFYKINKLAQRFFYKYKPYVRTQILF